MRREHSLKYTAARDWVKWLDMNSRTKFEGHRPGFPKVSVESQELF